MAELKSFHFGFDNLFDEINRVHTQDKYPPFNVVKTKVDIPDKAGTYDAYFIEMAVAGFNKNDIQVWVQGQNPRKLIISAAKTGSSTEGGVEFKAVDYSKPKEKIPTEVTNFKYLYKGLAKRAFEKTFDIGPDIEVGKIKLEDGILTVDLVDKPKTPPKQTFEIE